MPESPVYDLLSRMEGGNIILAYKGEISTELLEAVYSMMDKHLEEKKESPERRKKFFSILIECLQNVFHHQTEISETEKAAQTATGFVIRSEGEGCCNITTGNYIQNEHVENLKAKLDQVNSLSAEELRAEYRKSLAGNEFSEKGGAGLGIIEMARKSGKKLKYDFLKVTDKYSFFSLAITIP